MLSLNINKNLTPIIITFIIIVVEIAISFNSVLLPNIKLDLSLSDQIAQSTISIGLFALGGSGIIYGGLADSVGRKPMLICSISIFFLSTLATTFATTIEIFLIGKFAQGLGSGAAWVVGNACLKDIYSGKEYTKIMNYVHAIAGITPAVAPVIGSYLGTIIGWKGCFQILAFFSFIALLKIIFFQEETLKKKKPLCLKTFALNYIVIFKEKIFVKYLIIKVLCVMLIFVESSNVPLIFVDYMGIQPEYYGLYVLPLFLMYVLSTLISGKYIEKYHEKNMILFGLIMMITSNAAILATSSLTIITPVMIQICKIPCYMGWGLIFGNATAKIVSATPGKAGVASSIMIALEMIFSSLGITITGSFFDGTIIPVTYFMLAACATCVISMIIVNEE
jgi:DHA1 family bicyclomycin/chloramphenicol resistance-like MFS transporter